MCDRSHWFNQGFVWLRTLAGQGNCVSVVYLAQVFFISKESQHEADVDML